MSGHLRNGLLDIFLHSIQSVERLLGVQVLSTAKVFGVFRDLILEDLDRSQPGLGDLLVLVEEMSPDVVDVGFCICSWSFHSIRIDICQKRIFNLPLVVAKIWLAIIF